MKKRYPLLILMLGLICIIVGMSRCTTLPTTPTTALSPSPTPPVINTQQSCCEKAWPGTHDGTAHANVKGTGYFPDSSAMEGGFSDTHGKALKTVQAFLAGKSTAVSVATDSTIAPYGSKLCSPELSAHFGKALPLERTDTGGAFKGKQWSRMDLCVASNHDSLDSVVNGHYTLIECR